MSDKIPAGTYTARAIAGSEQYGATKNGTEQIIIDLDLPSIGRQLSTVLFFSDKAAPYSLERLRACGWHGDDVTQLAGIDANAVPVAVRYEMYDGKEQMKVEIITGGGRIKLETPMDAAAKRAFGASIKALIRSGAAPAGTRAAARPAPKGNAPPEDFFGGTGGADDIPF